MTIGEAATLEFEACLECGRQNPHDVRFCGGCGHMMRSAGVVEAVADPLIGREVADRYRILELLGRGGMGVVYKVEHIHIGKLMAMKLLHGELARDGRTVARFRREAEAASRLSHPNTVQVFDFGQSEGMMYLVMEYLEGEDLGDVIRGAGTLEFSRIARLAIQVCSSVSEAHERGVIHRDLKPENIMITNHPDRGETSKVLDFGLAKLRDQRGNMSVTNVGAIIGTPYYMSPEQIRGETVDARGDVYAIGAVLYKACTGVPPFVGATPMAVLTKHLTDALTLPSVRSKTPIPKEADHIIARAMAKKPEDRFQSCMEMQQALVDYLSGAGVSVTDPAVIIPPDQRSTVAPSARVTRAEVEKYELKLRRRGFLFKMMAVLTLAGLVGLSVVGYQHYQAIQAPPATEEMEPNNDPAQANVAPRGQTLTAYLGRRQTERIGDIDFYRIELGNQTGELFVEVSGIPNLDLELDLYRGGQTQALLSSNSAPLGGNEQIGGFPVQAPVYLLRVHERWIDGHYPIENVSDAYTLNWEVRPHSDGRETEVNDSLERAESLALGDTVSGVIGWGGDLDVYCISNPSDHVRLTLTGVEGLDLIMRPLNRQTARSWRQDEGGEGEGESSLSPGAGLCVEISAKPRLGSANANSEDAYELSSESATGGPRTMKRRDWLVGTAATATVLVTPSLTAATPVRIGRFVTIPFGVSRAHVWSTWGGSSARRHRSRFAAPTAPPSRIWETRLEAGPIQGPAITERGTLIVAGRSGIMALSADGVVQWTTVAEATDRMPVLLPGGAVVAGTRRGDLLFLRQGEITQRVAGARIGPPLALDDGSVIGLSRRSIRRISSTGQVLFDVALSGSVRGAVASDGQALWVPDGSTLKRIRFDGHQEWELRLPAPLTHGPVLAQDGSAWVLTSRGQLLSVSRSGRITLRVSHDAPPAVRGNLALAPDGTLRFAGTRAGLGALGSDGQALWWLSSEGPMMNEVCVDRAGVTLTTNSHEEMLAVDGEGQVVWKVRVGRRVRRAPILGMDGTIYLATAGGGGGGTLQAWRVRV